MKFKEDARVWGVLLAVGVMMLGLAVLGASGVAAQGQAGSGPPEWDPWEINPLDGPVDLGLTDPALVGAMDVHSHVDPSTPWNNGITRAIDFIEYAHLGKLRGVRGFVIKEHHSAAAAGYAYMIRKHIEPTLEVFGRMPLNFQVGGINVAAVDHFTHVRGGWGRIVEMPTIDAEWRYAGGPRPGREPRAPETAERRAVSRPWMALMPPGSPMAVSISQNGELRPEVKFLLEYVSRTRTADSGGRISISTGHSSGDEDVLLAREANRLGLLIVSPHGTQDMSPEQLQEYVRLGGFLELRQGGATAEWVRMVGAENAVVSSDCGFRHELLPTDCMAIAARTLREGGVSERELDLMFKQNPAKLVDIWPWRGSTTGSSSSAADRP